MIENDKENKNNLDNILKAIIEKMEHNDHGNDMSDLEGESQNCDTTISANHSILSENLHHLNLRIKNEKSNINGEVEDNDVALKLLKKIIFQWLDEKQYNINEYIKPNILHDIVKNTIEQKVQNKLDSLLKDIELRDIIQSTIIKILSDKLFNK